MRLYEEVMLFLKYATPTDSWLKWLERPHGTPATRVRLPEGADLRGLGKKIPSSDSLKARWFRTISRGERSRVRVQGQRFGNFLDLRERSSLPGIA